MPRRLDHLRLVALLALLVLASGAPPLAATDALPWVRLHDDGRSHGDDLPAPDPSRIYRAWPFCPTDRIPCRERELAWVEVAVGVDAYSLRRNDPHDSIRRILDVTAQDLRPLVVALEQHFEAANVTSHAERVAFIHGLVQGINYSLDTTTGWTEYPKFGLEFLVDEQGDCDDSAVLLATLLQSLGYEAWFVSWVGQVDSVSGNAGHLSNALTRFPGDLASTSPPAGSAWIPGPGGTRLLHIDGTGNPDGCGQAWVDCGGLGFNPWPERGLRVAKVIRASDPDLQDELPISAWNNGGLDRPDRTFVDRRDDSERQIREELQDGPSPQDRARRRLREVTGAQVSPLTFTFFVAVCVTVLALFTGYGWSAYRRRQERARARRGEREGREF